MKWVIRETDKKLKVKVNKKKTMQGGSEETFSFCACELKPFFLVAKRKRAESDALFLVCQDRPLDPYTSGR